MTQAADLGPLEWLPPLVRLQDHGGNWEAYLEAVYHGFRRDFFTSQPRIDGYRWTIKRLPISKGKEETFWHITSEGRDEATRIPSLIRCERIRWPRAMIDALGTTRVVSWENCRGREQRLLIALPDFSYLVVLAIRGDNKVMLWTAYDVQYRNARATLEKERREWLKRAGAASRQADGPVTPSTRGG